MLAHSFEMFGADFEDVSGKILLWGNINLSSPIKYISFDIILLLLLGQIFTTMRPHRQNSLVTIQKQKNLQYK